MVNAQWCVSCKESEPEKHETMAIIIFCRTITVLKYNPFNVSIASLKQILKFKWSSFKIVFKELI